MIDDIRRIQADAVSRLGAAATLEDLGVLERELLGKTSELTGFKKLMGGLDNEAKREVGGALNAAREAMTAAATARRADLEILASRHRAEAERLDLSEVRAGRDAGHLHLVTQTIEELEDVFVGMGFNVAEGPEVEDDWHNFTALNFGEYHPARDMQDTFFVGLGGPREVVMRTHTSPVQIRVMEHQAPPIYSVMPGRVYRNEATDATHLAVFHQIECLVVDRGITFGHLAGTIDRFTKAYFGPGWTSRLRPSYFPFTEPSAEVDMSTPDGGWLEIAGCGMVHPNVLSNCGIDPEEWTGFAFGIGIDRVANLLHGISDMRELVANDLRFLRGFNS